jgi:type II secretory pathway component PulF
VTQAADGPTVDPYQYEAQSPSGEPMRGTLEATSAADAQARLASLHLRVLSVTPVVVDKPPRRPARGLGLDDFLSFNQQLAQLTSAGLPVESGLRLIAADMRSGRMAAAADAVASDLEKGMLLKDAFARHSSRFPALYGRMVEAGVQAANLPAMLFNLGRHLAMMQRLRRTLWRAFSYPVAVLLVLAGVLLFVSQFILPRMADIFKDFHTTLPALTQFMLSTTDWLPILLLIVAVIIGLFLLVALLLRLTGRAGMMTDYVIMRLPIVGGILRASALARWCDSLRLGVDAGLDLPRAMALASEATGSRRIAQDSAALSVALSSGQQLNTIHRDLLPATVPAAFELASRSGDLSTTMGTLSRMYEQQADRRLHMLPGILTPVLVVITGFFIGLTVLAMFLPLVKLVQSVSGGG